MKSKRGSNKIYYYIDLFFILAPILLLIFVAIYNLIVIKEMGINIPNYLEENGYGWWDIFWLPYDYDGDDGFIHNMFSIVSQFFKPTNINDYNFFASKVLRLINQILTWFGISTTDWYDYDNLWMFISFYFAYLICYEIFSLIINIIMWLPRWVRNKVRDWTGSDSV